MVTTSFAKGAGLVPNVGRPGANAKAAREGEVVLAKWRVGAPAAMAREHC